MQVSQEAGKVVWYSHLFKNFLQFVVTHTVKGFDIVNDAEAVYSQQKKDLELTVAYCQHSLDHRKTRRIPEKHLFLLH